MQTTRTRRARGERVGARTARTLMTRGSAFARCFPFPPPRCPPSAIRCSLPFPPPAPAALAETISV
eukprot:532802-Rhodomonas_salina.1